MTEPTLFPVEPVPVQLTERQQFVLEQLRNFGEDGLDADEVGALLCARRGRHDAGTRCEYDSSNGTSVLKALKKKGLVRKRGRGGTWLALSTVEGSGASSAAESAQDAGEIPF